MVILLSSTAMSLPVADSPLVKKISISFINDPVVGSDSATCIIPFVRAGNLILLKAKADTTEGNFILDTGAPGLILNLTYFRDYPAAVVADEEQGSVAGSGNSFKRTLVGQLELGPVKYAKVEADLSNLGNIENSKGVKILGLLGLELFRRFEMIIDYEKNLLYLHLIGKKEANSWKHPMLKDTAAYNTLPFEIVENKMIIKTEMAGKKLKMMIDCGAESNVLDSRLPDKIFENVTLGRRVTLSGSGSQKAEAFYGDLRDMKIGNESISRLPVLITNLEKSCISFTSCIDGILGFDFLSLHKIGFNFVNRKMYIWK